VQQLQRPAAAPRHRFHRTSESRMTRTILKPAAAGRLEAQRRRRTSKTAPDGAADQDHGARVLHALTAASAAMNLQQLHVATALSRGDLVYVLPVLCKTGRVVRSVGAGGRYAYALATETAIDRPRALGAHGAAIAALRAYAQRRKTPQLTRLVNAVAHTWAQCEATGETA
jgi:hypothetical protein